MKRTTEQIAAELAKRCKPKPKTQQALFENPSAPRKPKRRQATSKTIADVELMLMQTRLPPLEETFSPDELAAIERFNARQASTHDDDTDTDED